MRRISLFQLLVAVSLSCFVPAGTATADTSRYEVSSPQELSSGYLSATDDEPVGWFADDAAVPAIPQSKVDYSLPILPIIAAQCDLRAAHDQTGELIGVTLGKVDVGNLIFDAGFRAGDTITKIITPELGELSASRMNEFFGAIAKAEGLITIEYIRDQRPRKISFTKRRVDQQNVILATAPTPTPFPVPTFVPSGPLGQKCFCYCPSGLSPGPGGMSPGGPNCEQYCGAQCKCRDNLGIVPTSCCVIGVKYPAGDPCTKALKPPTPAPTRASGTGGSGSGGSLRDPGPVEMNGPTVAEW